MDVVAFRAYCLAKPGVEESFPFDEQTLVFKVMGKMFAITGLDREEFTINLKCDPDWAVTLRETHDEILPGYHMNKQHWNTVNCEGELEEKLVRSMIDHSYELVVASLPKKLREAL